MKILIACFTSGNDSATICQYFVDMALHPSLARFPHANIIHHMEGILIASCTESDLQSLPEDIMTNQRVRGLQVVTEKNRYYPNLILH